MCARRTRNISRSAILNRFTTRSKTAVFWKNFNTGEFTEPRPYYTNNASLGYNVSRSNPGYFDDDQIYDLTADPDEDQNVYLTSPAKAYDLKKRLAGYLESISGRPFRQFNDASTEFSPAAVSAPAEPGAVQSQFLDLQNVRLNWTDISNSELGYVVEQSSGGEGFEIVAELPAGAVTSDLAIGPVGRRYCFSCLILQRPGRFGGG